jgi:hypothetical protein
MGQHSGQTVPNGGQTFGTKAFYRPQAAIAGGLLQPFQRSNPQVMDNPLGQLGPNAGHTAEDFLGRLPGLQLLPVTRPAGLDELKNDRGQPLPNALDPGEGLATLLPEDIAERGGASPHVFGPMAKGLNPMRVILVLFQ